MDTSFEVRCIMSTYFQPNSPIRFRYISVVVVKLEAGEVGGVGGEG